MSCKFLLSILVYLGVCVQICVQADIVEIDRIEDIRSYITQKNTLVLFDIDDTLITNSNSLGSPQWRAWVKNKLADHKAEFAVYDALTLYIAKNIPYKPVESSTATMIADLQSNDIPVFAFTARGRTQWYTTNIVGVDYFTDLQLKHVGIDFKNTSIPRDLQQLEPTYFYEGIIFAEHIQKGDLLKHLFKDLNYHPSLVIFIDDKLEQVKSVESALQEMGLPFIGFWYRRTEIDGKNFNPSVANIQLEHLLLGDSIIGNIEAEEIAATMPANDQQHYLDRILKESGLDILQPILP